MAGIGEASAILGTIQVGFSLAKALTTFVGDYQAANDDIVALAAQIDATFTHVKALEDLVEANKLAKSLDDSGVKLAQKCKGDSDRILKKLIKILTKAGVPNDFSRAVEPADISPSRLSKLAWPFLKPQVEFVKGELDSTRIEILLARSCIEARSGKVRADRTAARATIPGLARSLARSERRAEKMLKEARAKEGRPQQRPSSLRALDPDDEQNIQPNRIPSGIAKDKQTSYDSRKSSRSSRRYSSSGGYDAGYYSRYEASRYDQTREDEIFAQRLREEIEADIRTEKASKELKAEEEKNLQDEAVAAFKIGLIEQYDARKRELQMEEARLTKSFNGILTEEQIHKHVEKLPLQGPDNELVDMLRRLERTGSSSDSSVRRRSPSSSADERQKVNWVSSILSALLRPRRKAFASAASCSSDRDSSGFDYRGREFIHVLVTFDENDGCIILDGEPFKHDPCQKYCNFAKSMDLWAQVDEKWKRRASYLAARYTITARLPGNLKLHSAWRANFPKSSKMRRLINRALLGRELGAKIAREMPWSYVMVVFAVVASGTDWDRYEPSKTVAYNTDRRAPSYADHDADLRVLREIRALEGERRRMACEKRTAARKDGFDPDDACSPTPYWMPVPSQPACRHGILKACPICRDTNRVRGAEEYDNANLSDPGDNKSNDDENEYYDHERLRPSDSRQYAWVRRRSKGKQSAYREPVRYPDKHVRFAPAKSEPRSRAHGDDNISVRWYPAEPYISRRSEAQELSPSESVSQASRYPRFPSRDFYDKELAPDIYRSASPTEMDREPEPEQSAALDLDDDALSHLMLVKYTGGASPILPGSEEAIGGELERGRNEDMILSDANGASGSQIQEVNGAAPVVEEGESTSSPEIFHSPDES